MHIFKFILLTFLVLHAGCASLPNDFSKTESFSYETPEITSIGSIIQESAKQYPGKSAALLLDEPKKALLTRNSMAGIAEKTLDVQYYIWEDDKAGRLLFQRLLEAADRGVRVRVLLDDFTLSTDDIYLAGFNEHPNLEIRLFNPFAHRVAKGIGFLTDINRVNHRMHNKLFIVDNIAAIVGGRNIADHYFGISDSYNFRDLDVLTVGNAVKDISKSFDIFWNSEWSYPVSVFNREKSTQQQLDAFKNKLKTQVEEDIRTLPFAVDIDKDSMLHRFKQLLPEFDWVKIHVLYDRPEKVDGDKKTLRSGIEEVLGTIENEVVAEIAYFVPGKIGINNIRNLVSSGVNVRMLTNSLSSNDVLAAHSGYATYRKRLLKAGVKLYEYRADANDRELWSQLSHNTESRLHTKTFVIDRKHTFIGSFNFDPRSININTEVGLLIDSKKFAEKAIDILDKGTQFGNSYAVDLEEISGFVRWTESVDPIPIIHKGEPQSTIWERFKSTVIRILPVEHQL